MSTQPATISNDGNIFTTAFDNNHEDAVSLDGLEHIFKWASDMVADGEDATLKIAREKRIRRQVLEVVQKYQQEKAAAKSKDEISYLQRRVIALLQKLQEATEENAAIKQIMVSQYWTLQKIPQLEAENRQLKSLEYEREAAVAERKVLMDALAKLKVERDYIEDTLTAAEVENGRLVDLLHDARRELTELKSRRWWHFLLVWKRPGGLFSGLIKAS